MKENKIARVLNRIFNIIFLITFGYLFIHILLDGYVNEKLNYGTKERLLIIFGAVVLTVAFIFIYKFINTNNSKNLADKRKISNDVKTKIIIFSGVGIMFVIQLIIGYKLKMYPVTDLNILNKYAYDFAKNGNFYLIQQDYANNYVYMIRYQNNFAILFLLSAIYRIGYLIFGYIPMFLPVAFNSVMINLSVLFIVLCAKTVYGNRKAIMTLVLCFMFMPYYSYLPYYYTDSISMPFGIFALYLFICAVYNNKNKTMKKIVMLGFCGAILYLGFKLKASVAIILAAIVIYSVLKFSIKQVLCVVLSVVAGFGCVGAVYSAAFNASGLVSEQQDNSSRYPYSHWIMMGLKGLGHYNLADSNYTESFNTVEEKQEANIKEIKSRIKEMGPNGMLEHLTAKAVWTWEDGTYYISHHIEKPVKKNILHSFVLDKGEHHLIFYVYSCAFQLFLMFMIIVTIIKDCVKNEININTLFKGIVFAIFIFLLIWETRSRYLYNFTPIFILLSVSGLDIMTNFMSKIKSNIKLKLSTKIRT